MRRAGFLSPADPHRDGETCPRDAPGGSVAPAHPSVCAISIFVCRSPPLASASTRIAPPRGQAVASAHWRNRGPGRRCWALSGISPALSAACLAPLRSGPSGVCASRRRRWCAPAACRLRSRPPLKVTLRRYARWGCPSACLPGPLRAEAASVLPGAVSFVAPASLRRASPGTVSRSLATDPGEARPEVRNDVRLLMSQIYLWKALLEGINRFALGKCINSGLTVF